MSNKHYVISRNNLERKYHLNFTHNVEHLLNMAFAMPSYPPEHYITRNLFTEGFFYDYLHSNAPIVDYADYTEFESLLRQSRDEYCTMIGTVVHGHFQKRAQTQFNTYDLMVCGLVDFPEFLDKGRRILLRVTKDRGLQWVHRLNHHVATCLTTSCRTYITMTQRLPGMQRDSPNEDDCTHVMQETLLDLLTSERSYNSTCNFIGHALIPRNFRICYFLIESGPVCLTRLVLHRCVWREMKCMLVLLMHERCPNADAAALIFALVSEDSPTCPQLDAYYQRQMETVFTEAELEIRRRQAFERLVF